MKCPFCGYDKIQPNFNFCPNCKKSLKDNPKSSQHNTTKPNQQEKGFVNRWISGWTYDKAIADLGSYVLWALKNPNDNRRFLDKWKSQGCDVEIIIKAIGTARRARQEDPTINREDLESTIFDSNRQQMREEYNNDFVDAVNAEYTTNAAAIVRNKAIWKLQPGELARHIAPDEWVYVSEHLEGLVVEEGTSAIIYVDGEEVAQMGSGMYLFDKHIAAAEQEADLREKVKKGVLSRLVEGFFRLFSGHKKDEVASEREARRRRVQQILGRMRKDTIIDVFLKSDRVFPVVFGQQHLADSQDGYLPYTIQSRYTDVNIGVSMQMQIGNFKEFIANYMAGRKNVTIGDVTRVADTSVLSILRYELRDIEITERGLDEQTFNAIKEHLKSNLTNLLHGVKLVDILDIATTNEQLARFRKVEEQLYCSER